MANKFRSRLFYGKTGFFDSVGIGTENPTASLHLSGKDLRITSGEGYFEHRPIVSGSMRAALLNDLSNYYSSSNPSGFITGVDLSSYITTSQTGAFYANSNPSGFITGIPNIVYTTGAQSIYGIKTFANQTNVSGIQFSILTPEQVPPYQQGLVFYSDDTHTLNIYPDVPNASLQVGQKNWVRVRNGLPQTVNIGSVVYITGMKGNDPGFQLSIASSEAGSAKTLGIAANTMLENAPGYITTFGIVNGINTSSYAVGQTLYLSTSGSGQFSSLKPVAPNHMVRVGTVLTSKNDGSVFVNVQNGFELDELHDVLVNSATSGQFLFKNNSVWSAKTLEIFDVSGLQFSLDQKQITGDYYPASNPSGFITSLSANVVYTTGDQTVNGVKNFTQRPTFNGTGLLLSGEASAGGDYYPNSNPSGFITGVDLSNYITNLQTGQFYPASNPSGFLTTATVSGSYVASITGSISGASQIKNMIRITQSGYNALTPDAETFYIIVG